MSSPAIRSNLLPEVRRLLGLALRRSIGGDETPARDSDPGWDSLKHIEIIFLLEDHFELRFTPLELEQLNDAAQIARVLEARFAA